MKTWLLTWNKDKWGWDDYLNGYKELINDIRQVGHAYCKWTCGINKSISSGDRVFLIKLGSEPKGIVASGYAATKVFEGTHWDRVKDSEGKLARRIFVDFDWICDYESDKILELADLKRISETFKWSSQSSGISIPDSIACKIEERWKTIKKI